MSFLKSKVSKSLFVLTLALTTLLSSSSTTPIFAATPGASAATIEFMKTETVNNTNHATPANFKITLNGKPVQLSAPILVENGTTLLPIRAIAELLGIEVGYDSNYKVAIASSDNITLEVPIGYSFGVVNGKKVNIPNTHATLYNATTYLPLRYIADQLNIQINYSSATKIIEITTDGSSAIEADINPRPTVVNKDEVVSMPGDTEDEEVYGAGITAGKTAQEVFDANERASAIDPSYLKAFASKEEIKKVLPYLNDQGVSYVMEHNKYAVVNMNITEMVNYIGGSRVAWSTTTMPTPFEEVMIRFKDGSYTMDYQLPQGKTIKDVSYFVYTQDGVTMLVKIGKVDTSSFRL